MIRYYVYSALVTASPDVPLSVEGGTITLDSTRAPHVQADIRVRRPSAATLALLDPRRSPAPRVRVVVNEAGGGGRTFDLTVRDLDSTQGGDQLTITAHSDEALASDYSPLLPQVGIWQLSARGVRPVVDWVLSQVPGVRKNYLTWSPRIGAGDSGTGSAPESGRSASPWVIHKGTGAVVAENPDFTLNHPALPKPNMSALLGRWDTPATGGAVAFDTGLFPVPSGESTASIHLGTSFSASSWRAEIRWCNSSGAEVSSSFGAYEPFSFAGQRFKVTATRPAGATFARIRVRLLDLGSIIPGTVTWVTGAQFESGNTMSPYVDSVLDYSTVNAPIECTWPLTNLIVNPSFELGTEGWEIHSGVSELRTVTNTGIPNNGARLEGNDCARWTVTGVSGYIRSKPMTVQAGRWYQFFASVAASSTLASVHTIMRFLDAGGMVLRNVSTSYGTYGEWSSAQAKGQAPEGAASVIIYIGLTGANAGMMGYLDCVMLAEDVENNQPQNQGFGYFSGATPATAAYTFAWTGDPHKSASTRTPINERPAGILVWEPGTSALGFLAPLLQSVGIRLVCDANRQWTLRDEGYQVPGAMTIRYGVNMVAGRDLLERSEWYDAAVTRYRWRNAYGEELTRDDRFGSASATRTRLFEKDAVWPGRGFSEYAVRRAKQRGRLVTVTAVTDFDAVAEQGVSIALEALSPQIGLAERVEFSLDRDEMTITSRTTDTRTGSIDALTGTINALTGTINNL